MTPADQVRCNSRDRSRSPFGRVHTENVFYQDRDDPQLGHMRQAEDLTGLAVNSLHPRRKVFGKTLVELSEPEHICTGTSSGSTTRPADQARSNSKGMHAALTIELCAGTAGLTAELRHVGFDSIGIDHRKNRHSTKAPCVLLDLATDHGQQICLLAIRSGRCFYIHAGVPCGTASRARNKKTPAHLRRQGAPEPMPLRSESEPWGLSGLSGMDARKVQQANDIYSFCLLCIKESQYRGLYWSVENPRSSFLWNIPGFAELLLQSKGPQSGNEWTAVYCVDFQSCNHGGKRDKWTRLLTSMPDLMVLAGPCEGGHDHLPWGVSLEGSSWVFATAEEAAYPRQLCVKMATAVSAATIRHGYLEPPRTLTDQFVADPTVARLRQRAAVQKQPRGRRLPPLVAEHKDVLVKQIPAETAARLPAVGKQVIVPLTGIPVGARLLRRQPVATVAGESPLQPDVQVVLGIPWTPSEFIDQVSRVTHPTELMGGTDDFCKEAVFQVLTTGEQATEVRRRLFINTWQNVRDKLAVKEKALHSAMPSETQRVLAGKNLLLLDAMLTRFGYPDKDLVKDIVAGFSLTGMQKSAKVFTERVKLPEITVQELMRTCKRNRAETRRGIGSSGDGTLDAEVWKQTWDEVEQGWLTGPLDEHGVSAIVGPLWTLARRFGILQSGKTRVIDDYSEPYVNAAYGGLDKLNLGGVDEIAAMLKEILLAIRDDRTVLITFSSGKQLRGVLHASMEPTEARDIVGRTLDMKAAYRQLPVASSSAWSSVIAVYDPQSGTAKLYLQRALPFGATASVYASNRFAKALHFLGVVGLQLWWSQFFDDFPHLCSALGAESALRASRDLMSLVGCSVADAANKDKPFAKRFTPLGVEFNLDQTTEKQVTIGNKPVRAEGLEVRVAKSLLRGHMSAPEAAELRGTFQYAAAQLFGRVMTPAMRQLSIRANSHGAGHLITDRLSAALESLVFFVKFGKPRFLDFSDKRRPVIIACDGACEGMQFEIVTVGGVMLDLQYGDKEFFGDRVDKQIVECWTEGTPGQVIGQAELLPIAMSRLLWSNRLQGRRVIYAIDNDAARDGLIKADSPSRHSAKLIDVFFKVEAAKPSWPWFMRVASAFNPADGPSRLSFDYMNEIGAKRVFPKQPIVVADTLEFE